MIDLLKEKKNKNKRLVALIDGEHHPQVTYAAVKKLKSYYAGKFVGIISSQLTDVPFSGMRVVNEIQFAGLWNYSFLVHYPSRTFDPFFRLNYKDIPLRLYDSAGLISANYKNRSAGAVAGIGMFLSGSIRGELSYTIEEIDTKPVISSLDPVEFTGYKADLRLIRASIDFDYLDDIYMPKKGFQIYSEFEASL
jgi:hypothetical protein